MLTAPARITSRAPASFMNAISAPSWPAFSHVNAPSPSRSIAGSVLSSIAAIASAQAAFARGLRHLEGQRPAAGDQAEDRQGPLA